MLYTGIKLASSLVLFFLWDQYLLWLRHFLFQNFEKITSRVQSKNKDQVIYGKMYLFIYLSTYLFFYAFCFTYLFFFFLNISIPLIWQVRHYYYRLVRRMNKLLGPELCLDAKNSKDTNAAMLRWYVVAVI